MTIDLLKSYLKYEYKVIIGWIVFIIVYNWHYHIDWYMNVIFLMLGPLHRLYHFNDKLERLKKLKEKGLTGVDVLNIEFVKKWETTRKEGLWRYCVRDGGIITGFGLSLALSLIYFIIYANKFRIILSDPEHMFRFILISYIAGVSAGVIIFRIFWFFKERRFARLTDPLNTIFRAKNLSFDDQV